MAGRGTTTGAVAVGEERRRLPEAGLNRIILRWAFIDKAISGFGALALAWATIVLLGGFSTLIKQKDFWFVTVISFLEATRFVSSSQLENLQANSSHGSLI
ncbi:hypothetical protein ZEAMMB73_Zm00001d004501 [Zea mays]|jgi:hypothetical protein|uniref:Uncharacterized protein n=1 Tax=Zea mays TaxID=4577 RepID=A0A1D6EFT1_MAIZE|nr:hypothetical protein ZEAMMB73_Zm00001d004501 [Zea mays]